MNIAIINQGGSRYLFEVPESISLKEGEKVKCDTKRGVNDGTVWADSITADEPAAKLIGKLLGAKFPLKSVVGKMEYQPFEQPEQPKREPVKLYCVKESDVSRVRVDLTKGKVYEFDGHFIEYDCGTSAYFNDLEDWKRGDPDYAACLVPLVSRPAKVGEYVLITADGVDGTEKGEICEAVRANHSSAAHMYLRTKKPTTYGCLGITPCTLASRSEYLVLDGYKPEPEKAEPEYYSGKVVCVKATNVSVTVGKAYTVENGIFTWDSGTRSNTKATTIEQFNNCFVAAKFIEFKGE